MDKFALNITLQKGLTDTPASDLPPIVSESFIFKGDASSPLLAPRGVFLANGRLIVSDTGQNRVFIWNDVNKILQSDGYLQPDVILGQNDKNATSRNAGEAVSASTLQYPSGLWSDGQRLIVADAWNHRVLIWHTFPTRHGQAADVVIGQPDFNNNNPNIKGIGYEPDERSLNWCYGVFSNGKRLWIADTGNRRVLYYNHIPIENYTAANVIVGKTSFNERDYDNNDAIWPYSVKISPTGQLAITDTQYYRVLLWQDWRRAFTQKADVIIGQPDFESNGMNQFSLFPQANTLSWCYDSYFYKDGIFITDTGNSRILWFKKTPQVCNVAADNLIGKPHFNMGSENHDTIFGTEKSLYWPFSICIEGNLLALADTGNHRIVIYKLLI